MTVLDIRTFFLLCGLLYFALAAGSWLASTGSGPRDPANAAWFGGGMLTGVGLLLLGMRGIIPGWSANVLPGLLIPLGGLQMLRGIHHKLALPWRRSMEASACAIFLASFFVALAAGHGLFARQLCIGTESLLSLALAFRLMTLQRDRGLRASGWMALVFACLSVGLWVRMVALWLGQVPDHPLGPLNTLASSNVDVAVMLVPAVFAAVLGNLGYLGLELQESAQLGARLAAGQARQEYSAVLMAQIAHLERQRSLAEMATTLAHELKQPLTATLSNIQLAQRMVRRVTPVEGEGGSGETLHGELTETLVRAVNSTRHATAIVNRISGYARATSTDKQRVDVEAVVRGVLDLLAGEAVRQDVQVRLQGLPAPAMVLADAVQISQVLVNLLRNAMQALQGSAQRDVFVTISQHGGQIGISVRDTGPGVSEEVAAKAGTPFFTTRPDGMGVGLSIASAIAVQHGGQLRLANAPEGGAQASLTLPEASAQPHTPTSAQAGPGQPAVPPPPLELQLQPAGAST
jgi:signal transduction histidine kinase